MPSGPEIIQAIPIIISLILIEGLLSVDNALAIAAMASHLPPRQQKLALRLGIIGAYAFRGLTLALVVWIQNHLWIKYFGAGYLVYLMCSHLTQREEEHQGEHGAKKRGLVMTIISIELMDLTLSIDNVLAAVALSNKLWVIITGVFIGILALRLLAGYAIGLISRFPVLGKTAFLLVGYVGFLLIFETMTLIHLGPYGKFAGICLILAASLAYNQSKLLQSLLDPVIRVVKVPMRLFAQTVGLVAWPVHFVVGKIKSAPPSEA